MNIPVVLEIHTYSVPETEIVQTRIQRRLCNNEQIPTAVEVQTTEQHTIDAPEFESVDGILVDKKQCCHVPPIQIGHIFIFLMCISFFWVILFDTINFVTK